MLNKRELIIAKAEYILGRKLSNAEINKLLKKIKVGSRQELKRILMNGKNDFVPIEKIIRSKHIKDDILEDELKDIIKEIAIKSTSVESGLKIMKHADNRNKTGLLKYIYNLYLRDVSSREKKAKIKKKAEGREPIITYQPELSPSHMGDSSDNWGYVSYYNPDQTTTPTKQNEYDTNSGYLTKEWHTHPSQNESKKKPKKKKNINKYIPQLIGQPISKDEGPVSTGGKT